MKRPHSKYFIIFYFIAFLATCTPLVKVANIEALWFGMPALFTYLMAWSTVVMIVLSLNYRLDIKFEERNRYVDTKDIEYLKTENIS